MRPVRLNLESLDSRINPSEIRFIGSSDTLRFDGAAGELNTVTLSVAANGTLTIQDTGNIITIDPSAAGLGFAGAGTSTLTGGDLNQMSNLLILLGDNNDSLLAREIPIQVRARGDAGNDTITLLMGPISSANDVEGGSGNDTLIGGSGNDFLNGDSGNDVVDGGDGDDQLLGGTGDDVVDGGDGDDVLFGSSGDDSVLGGDGSDILNGFSGADLLKGGDGFDTLSGGAGNDILSGGDRLDTVSEAVNGIAIVTAGFLKTPTETDNLDGIEIVNLTGGGGNDQFNAALFPGTVVLAGAGGNDTLIGGTGNDVLSGNQGNDLLKGGGGLDTVAETGDANFTLTNTTLAGTGVFGIDTLAAIERGNLTGGSGNNVLNASAFTAGSVLLVGGNGDDTLTGGAGNDILRGEGGNNRLFGRGGNDNLESFGGNATVTGGPGNDIVNSEQAANIIIAETSNSNFAFPNASTLTGAGQDLFGSVDGFQLTGGAGNNVFDLTNMPAVNVTIVGGAGTDTIKVAMNAALTVLTNTQLSIGGQAILLNSVERAHLEGGAAANEIDASGFTLGPVTLKGGAGNDTLLGGSKNDLLDGGDNTDELTGGLGVDTLLNGEVNNP